MTTRTRGVAASEWPNQLQTSPYLTLVRPGKSARVIYVTDTRGPEYPELSPPTTGAVFGVIGLDRSVVWHDSHHALLALESAALDPVDTTYLVAEYGRRTIGDLMAREWLQAPSSLCTEYRLLTAQIEVTAHCNWGCQFCPVAADPKPRETMSMPLFGEIIDKLKPHTNIRFVTFHFFNEPTLDPHFEDRVRLLAESGLKLSLSTNLSALTPGKIKLLTDTGVLHHLVVNLPSENDVEFQRLTGSRTLTISQRNLERAIEAGWPITIAVNGTGDDLRRNVRKLRERYSARGVEVRPTLTCDRAGAVGGHYNQAVHITGRLRGCSWPLNHAYFSVRGDLFICCNDYYQREVYGNIRDGTLHDVMVHPRAVKLRRRVFGVEDAPKDYICRTCHDQELDFPHRQFRPVATFPISAAPDE